MSNGSMFNEFYRVKVAGRAKLIPRCARFYLHLETSRWYGVADVGQDQHGVFLDPGDESWHYVSRVHFQIERLPD